MQSVDHSDCRSILLPEMVLVPAVAMPNGGTMRARDRRVGAHAEERTARLTASFAPTILRHKPPLMHAGENGGSGPWSRECVQSTWSTVKASAAASWSGAPVVAANRRQPSASVVGLEVWLSCASRAASLRSNMDAIST